MGLLALVASGSEVNSTWYERSWQSAEGLPDNSVVGVVQTRDGYLWIATAGVAGVAGVGVFSVSPGDRAFSGSA